MSRRLEQVALVVVVVLIAAVVAAQLVRPERNAKRALLAANTHSSSRSAP
jgi:hypothetical protein